MEVDYVIAFIFPSTHTMNSNNMRDNHRDDNEKSLHSDNHVYYTIDIPRDYRLLDVDRLYYRDIHHTEDQELQQDGQCIDESLSFLFLSKLYHKKKKNND